MEPPRTVLAALERLIASEGEADVGIIGDDAEREYVSGTPPYPTTAEVATWQEYGTVRDGEPHIPPRAFMRRAADASRDALRAIVGEAISEMLTGENVDELHLLTHMSRVVTDEVHRSLQTTASWATPLAPVTSANKGHNWPLHETMNLSTSISYEVRVGGRVKAGRK